jgi:hypothetical protein
MWPVMCADRRYLFGNSSMPYCASIGRPAGLKGGRKTRRSASIEEIYAVVDSRGRPLNFADGRTGP